MGCCGVVAGASLLVCLTVLVRYLKIARDINYPIYCLQRYGDVLTATDSAPVSAEQEETEKGGEAGRQRASGQAAGGRKERRATIIACFLSYILTTYVVGCRLPAAAIPAFFYFCLRSGLSSRPVPVLVSQCTRILHSSSNRQG